VTAEPPTDGLAMVVGIGNPGAKYARTRHNAGFLVVDALAERWALRDWHKKRDARYALDRERRTLLVEPQSYVNLSGDPVLGMATFYKIPPERILIVVDELDLPFGTLRMRAQGSSGGHNGLKSIIDALGTGFPRLRIGIGRGHADDAIERVLSPFTPDEREALPAIVDRAVEGVELWRSRGVVAAMNRVNAKEPPPEVD
jgi:PTH1 family peptidyl-tRNA hydrolase